jgi:hypothetical protein
VHGAIQMGGFGRNLRASAAWLGTPVGLVALWLLADAFAGFAPGTALTLGLLGMICLTFLIGAFFFVFRR